jgi:osmotically inducible protein OsmC
MPETILYTAVATSTGDGRNGHVRSSDGLVDTDVRTPKEMGGAGGATNPEQLFAAGYAACFHSALKLTSKQAGISISDSAVTAEVGIGPNGAGGFGLAVTLHVELGGVSQEEGEKAVQLAHAVCPYSNATRGNIDVQLVVEVA